MNRILIAALALPLLALALALASPSTTTAQSSAHWDVDLGIAAGPETLPAALRTRYKHPSDPALGVGAGLRLTVGRVGPFSVEGRASIHSGDMEPVMAAHDLVEVPMATRETATTAPGPQAAWDLRLRFGPGGEGARGAVWTLGGGLMTGGVRYIAGSAGHQGKDGRIGIELDVGAYQVPWRTQRFILTEDPDEPDLFIVESATTTYTKRWDLGLGLRLVYTFDLWS